MAGGDRQRRVPELSRPWRGAAVVRRRDGVRDRRRSRRRPAERAEDRPGRRRRRRVLQQRRHGAVRGLRAQRLQLDGRAQGAVGPEGARVRSEVPDAATAATGAHRLVRRVGRARRVLPGRRARVPAAEAMMGWRSILILFALVAGLGVVLLLTDESTPVAKQAESPVLEGRALAEATMVRWQFRDRPPIEVGRGPDGRFQLREPLVDVASAAHMKQICDVWESAQMRKAPLADDAEGRRQAGLETPELAFLARYADGHEIRIDVGAEGPLGTTRFLRAHGAIWEGGQALLESMRANPDDLREKAVFRNAFGSVDELRVEHLLDSGVRETVHLKLADGGWRLLAPVTGRADPTVARQFMTAVLSL
ncbi:MAG: DUF4340 domain-containing protein, partial [Planctomycetes bacterium]|nr:DUF4340 domain-containing protein [Planctomycetota bacterium]